MKTVGILGGGQLGLLLVNSLSRLGARAVIYDPDKYAPAVYHASESICAPWQDTRALDEFFQAVDIATYEFENIDISGLLELDTKKPICPALDILEITQDRIREKQFMRDNELPHAFFVAVYDKQSLLALEEDLPYPCMLKTSRGGYDGKGQLAVEKKEDFAAAVEKFWKPDLTAAIVEEKLELDFEVSCIIARSGNESAIFPVLENVHKEQILESTIIPSRLPEKVQSIVMELAARTAELLELKGILTTEFFIAHGDARASRGVECDGFTVFINEFAPRPHNSGHVTMNACTSSQFDALARILLDIPLSTPRITSNGVFCMMNLLGDIWLEQGNGLACSSLDLRALSSHPHIIDLVLYGKTEARAKRKMGHFVSHGENIEDAMTKALSFRESLHRKSGVSCSQ